MNIFVRNEWLNTNLRPKAKVGYFTIKQIGYTHKAGERDRRPRWCWLLKQEGVSPGIYINTEENLFPWHFMSQDQARRRLICAAPHLLKKTNAFLIVEWFWEICLYSTVSISFQSSWVSLVNTCWHEWNYFPTIIK